MTDRPTLAMLIPAYNAAGYLPRLLQSAAAQTKPFDEIWVYDDCSTDNTAAVAERFGARVVRGEVNRGCSAGKNALAAHVGADWLHFHDADDELMPNFVALARRWIDDGRYDVVLFAYEYRDDVTNELISVRSFDPSDVTRDARSYAIREQINPFCGLYRREAFLRACGYIEDPLVLYNEDVAFHISLAFAGLTFAAETEVSIINYRRLNSMSAANALRCAQAHYHVLRKTAERPESGPYAAAIATKLWGDARVLAAHLDWKTADAAAALAMKLSPQRGSNEDSALFRALAAISPPLALRACEELIRRFKPHLRNGYPGRRRLHSPLGKIPQ